MKQNHLMKKTFLKEIDSKIARAAYPKVFSQVWPVIPIYDRTILDNYGLESILLVWNQ